MKLIQVLINMIIVGIDNGYKGGIGYLDTLNNLSKTIIMPTIETITKKKKHTDYDIYTIISMLKIWNPDLVILENAHAMPGQGVTSMFNFGVSFGIMHGILSALNIEYIIVQPKKWQKYIFKDVQDTGDTKRNAFLYLKNRFPNQDFLATKRSKIPHSGICDALAMACYGETLI